MQILEAFRALNALNEDTFDLDANGINQLSDFKNNDDFEDDISIIDPEAETETDLQDNYIGKVILDCCVCHSKLYKDKSEIEVDETGELANVGEECPYCYTSDGFKVIGEVTAFNNDDDTGAEDEPIEEFLDANVNLDTRGFGGKDNNVSVLGGGLPLANESLEEGIFNFGKKKKQKAEAERKRKEQEKRAEKERAEQRERDRGAQIARDWKELEDRERQAKRDYERSRYNSIKGSGSSNTGYRGISYSGGDYYSESLSGDGLPLANESLEEGLFDFGYRKRKKEADRRNAEMRARLHQKYQKKAEDERDKWEQEQREKDARSRDTQRRLDAYDSAKRNSSSGRTSTSNTGYRGISYSGGDYYSESLSGDGKLDESIDDLALTANDTHIEVHEDEGGKVTVSAEPATSNGGETIAPVSPETESEILAGDEMMPDAEFDGGEEEIDVPIDEVDEGSFDESLNSYFKKAYENVNSYRTTGVKSSGNTLIVEGRVRMNDHKVQKTSFILEAKDVTKDGRVRFVGGNKQLTENKKAFTVTGKVRNNKLITESMSYNYRAKNSNGKMSRVYGIARTSARRK